MAENLVNALSSGTLLDEYRVERVLGEGGFGITYLVEDTSLGIKRAVKEYLPIEFALRSTDSTVTPRSDSAAADYQWGLDRFVVPVVRFFEASEKAYMVMAYQEGETLDALLDRQDGLDESVLRPMISSLLDGLQAMHDKGILHRDLKPANIFIKSGGVPLMLDFGAARYALGMRSKSLSAIVSEGYSPWEQYSSIGDAGPWTDIYTLGATLYRAICGERPPPGPDRALDDRIVPARERGEGRYADDFLSAVDWALAVRPEDRPPDISAWRDTFDDTPAEDVPSPPSPRTDSPSPSIAGIDPADAGAVCRALVESDRVSDNIKSYLDAH
jgi:serine/threonine protein kinase